MIPTVHRIGFTRQCLIEREDPVGHHRDRPARPRGNIVPVHNQPAWHLQTARHKHIHRRLQTQNDGVDQARRYILASLEPPQFRQGPALTRAGAIARMGNLIPAVSFAW